MKQIPLTQGKFALVDDADFEYFAQWIWTAQKDNGTYYATRKIGKFPFNKTLRMHRVIMNTPEGMLVDHIDGDGLNNTRVNLRNCTVEQNGRNRRKNFKKTEGYKGVRPSWSNWRASIKVNGKTINLGSFSTPEEAARAYDEAAKKYFGEFANTNF